MNDTPKPVPVPTLPTRDKSKTRTVIVGTIAGVVVLLAAVYFFVVPTMQINAYKKSATNHAAVDAKLTRVYDNFKRDLFTKIDTKPSSDRIDIQDGRDAIKDAQTAIDANKSAMTSFKPLPLLGLNQKYKIATDTDKNEETYVKNANKFLKDYTELLDYFSKETDLSEKYDKITNQLDTLSGASSVDALVKTLNTATASFQAAIDEEKAITPPDYLVSFQTDEVSSANELVGILKQLSAAVKALDLNKIESLATTIEQDTKKFDALAEKYVTTLHQDSRIALDIVGLRSLNSKISAGYAKL